ncbi:MAG: tetratricopeptide repeat protein, partial [Acetobacteraceae bacterium]
MPDIFDEVEEELRAERTKQLLTRYAGVIVTAVVLVVVIVAGWQMWRWHQAKQDQAAAVTYVQAMLEAGDTGANAAASRAAALGGFARLDQNGPAGYQTLARLHAAALEASAGHLPQALALWDAV